MGVKESYCTVTWVAVSTHMFYCSTSFMCLVYRGDAEVPDISSSQGNMLKPKEGGGAKKQKFSYLNLPVLFVCVFFSFFPANPFSLPLPIYSLLMFPLVILIPLLFLLCSFLSLSHNPFCSSSNECSVLSSFSLLLHPFPSV